MTSIRLATASLLLAVAAPVLAADTPTKDSIAAVHGLDHWDQIEEIRFTFYVNRPDQTIERRWNWSVTDDKVTLLETSTPAKGDPTTTSTSYRRDSLDDDAAIAADKKFINDSFWLLWPLHLQWSDEATLGPVTYAIDPFTGLDCRLLTLSYPGDGGGYTPGDSYELYFSTDGDWLLAWSYHKAGAPEPTLTCTWERYQRIGPLNLSTHHQNKDGSFRLHFEDAAVRLKGSKDWISAIPSP